MLYTSGIFEIFENRIVYVKSLNQNIHKNFRWTFLCRFYNSWICTGKKLFERKEYVWDL